MDDYTGVCVGGPADGETFTSALPRLTYVWKVDGAFDNATYLWDGKSWEYKQWLSNLE